MMNQFKHKTNQAGNFRKIMAFIANSTPKLDTKSKDIIKGFVKSFVEFLII